jgi:hypothetical protein
MPEIKKRDRYEKQAHHAERRRKRNSTIIT